MSVKQLIVQYKSKDYTLNIGDIINQGAFGKVYKSDDLIDNTSIVIKVTQEKPKWIPGMPKKDFLDIPEDAPDIKFFRGVVRYFDIQYIDKNYYIVMEKLDYELDELPCTNVNNVYYYLTKLIRNIQTVHKNGYCILDIKPANIMIKGFNPYFIDLDFLFHYTSIHEYTKPIFYSGTPVYNSVYTLLEQPTLPADNIISLLISAYDLLDFLPWDYTDCNDKDKSTNTNFSKSLEITASMELKQLVKWANEIYDHIREILGKRTMMLTKAIYKDSFKELYKRFYSKDPMFGIKYLFVYLHMIPRKPDTFIDYDWIISVLNVYHENKIISDHCANLPRYVPTKNFCNKPINLDKHFKFRFDFNDSWSCYISIEFVKGIIKLLKEMMRYAKPDEVTEIKEIIQHAPTCKTNNSYLWDFIQSEKYITIANKILSYNDSKELKSIAKKLIYINQNFSQ